MLAVIGCLASGVPLKAQENPLMTEFLQFLGARLPGGSHLNQHVPFILKEEANAIEQDLGNRSYSIIYDGTPELCECFGIGIQLMDNDRQVGNMPILLVLCTLEGFRSRTVGGRPTCRRG